MAITVTAVYERDEAGNWLAHLAEEPRCHTWGRSLQSARCAVRDAAELWREELGADDAALRFLDQVKGIEGAAEATHLAMVRLDLTEHLARVRAQLDELAPRLLAQGLSVRDVAGLVELSPGRVSQIAPGAKYASLPDSAAHVGRRSTIE